MAKDAKIFASRCDRLFEDSDDNAYSREGERSNSLPKSIFSADLTLETQGASLKEVALYLRHGQIKLIHCAKRCWPNYLSLIWHLFGKETAWTFKLKALVKAVRFEWVEPQATQTIDPDNVQLCSWTLCSSPCSSELLGRSFVFAYP